MLKRRVGVCLAAALLVGSVASADDRPLGPGRLHWIIQVHALDLISREPDGSRLGREYFDDPKTFVLAGDRGLKHVPRASIATQSFKSYVDLSQAFATGSIDSRVRAILYDGENWPHTPAEERVDQGKFNELAAELVHGKGLTFITSPASNLADVVDPAGEGTKFERFARSKIAEAAAVKADVYEIQAQGAAIDAKAYRAFVAAAAEQAKRANPSVIVLAGLSTNPAGKEITVDQLFEAVLASRDLVDGYWLNLPGKSDLCPSCSGPHPEIAVALLNRMASYQP